MKSINKIVALILIILAVGSISFGVFLMFSDNDKKTKKEGKDDAPPRLTIEQEAQRIIEKEYSDGKSVDKVSEDDKTITFQDPRTNKIYLFDKETKQITDVYEVFTDDASASSEDFN